MEVRKTDGKDLENALSCLRQGGIILYPTDTIWGMGCDACDAEAVRRLFELKHRPDSKSMLLLCCDLNMVKRYVESIPDEVTGLLARSARPTTVIYNGAHDIPSRLIAADGSVGIRIPAHDFSNELCRRLGHPIVSTSANFAGMPAPSTYADISAALTDAVDYVCTSERDNNVPANPSDILKVNPDGSIHKIRVFVEK